MTKRIIIVIILATFFACNKDKEKFDKSLLIGNWASISNDTYQEYFISDKEMYVYNPYSGDIIEYRYYIQGDSIFRSLSNPDIINPEYLFYSRAVKFDKNQINLRTKALYKLKENNTLEMYIKNETDSLSFTKASYQRESVIRERY